ncbi:hypothetical protein [Vibrio coralliilyticus]|uniref:hypothetical protein n=1 Tax=Vibrio coralliilyticus TaxID=190893 RepID=UPI00148DC73B|nr:hypothetical protein [Vibrio coralliilyticus]NOI29546.1 hypothetical protein [Vibrio coralliilyticus]NOI48795.1 hypothetical protein [Vibrio coralliilyticus]WFB49907.1 hypothetical protein P6988_24000 [Vibrio coralliilyticus]
MVETIDSYRKLLLPYVIALGILIYFYYCMSIGFYPTKISIADTLFFLWILLIFGLFYLVILHAFLCISVLLSSLLGKLLNRFISKRKDSVPFPTLTNNELLGHCLQFIWGTVFLYLWIDKVGPTTPNIIGVVTVIMATTFGYVFVNKAYKDKSYIKSELHRKLFLISMPIGIAFLPVFFIDGALQTTTNLTFEKVGVRQSNVDIKVKTESLIALKNHPSLIAKSNETTFNEEWLIDVEILFTGVGDTTKLRINKEQDIVIPNEQIQLIVSKN